MNTEAISSTPAAAPALGTDRAAAEEAGRQAALAGRPLWDCTHAPGAPLRAAWINAYRHALAPTHAAATTEEAGVLSLARLLGTPILTLIPGGLK